MTNVGVETLIWGTQYRKKNPTKTDSFVEVPVPVWHWSTVQMRYLEEAPSGGPEYLQLTPPVLQLTLIGG